MKIFQHSGSLLKTVRVDINKVATQILDGQNWRGCGHKKSRLIRKIYHWEDLSIPIQSICYISSDLTNDDIETRLSKKKETHDTLRSCLLPRS